MTENELRSKVCAQAKAWLGRKEADGSHREIIDIYNRGKLPGTYVMTYADPWCAAFVSAVGMACDLRDVILPHVNCEGMIAAYRAQGRWIEQDDFVPQAGDVIFYDWDDNGVGDNTGTSDHVGIVVSVENYYMTVIEGNKSDSVSTRTLAIGSRYIRGFAVPDYASKAAGDSSPAPQNDKPAQPVPTKAPDLSFLPTLSRGSTGRSVVVAQGILIALGYSCGPDGADGDLGYNSWNAVCRFQRDHGLTVDGVIGQQTWAKMMGVT